MHGSDLAREAEILSYQVLDAPELPALRQVAQLAATLTGASVAEVNLVTATEIHRIATSNDNAGTSVANELGFCARVIATAESSPHVVPDTRNDDLFRSNPHVTGPPNIRFYAGSTLTSPRGITYGTLCVYDPGPVEFTAEHAEVFELLAALVTEVLEQHRLESDLAGALRRLADSHHVLGRSNESLQAFAGQVSHDLRGPLTTIRLALEMATGPDVTDPEERDYLLARALSGVQRMGTTVQDVMDFALLGGRTERERVDLAAVMADVLADLDGVSGDARIQIDELPSVHANEGQVRAVLQNLVSNAIKFSA
ncbi:MAG: sensor histidine kinase, partial [Myxococcales bacterium]